MTHSMDDMLSMLQKYLIFDLKEHFADVSFRDENNLIQVMKDIYSKTKCSFVILIDEWDCLFREYQQDKEAQKEYLDFLKANGFTVTDREVYGGALTLTYAEAKVKKG